MTKEKSKKIFGFFLKICLTQAALIAIIIYVAAVRRQPDAKREGFGPVVQLVRTLACHARGRQFEPDPGRHMLL